MTFASPPAAQVAQSPAGYLVPELGAVVQAAAKACPLSVWAPIILSKLPTCCV